jgi:hypothetical protein
MDTTEVQPVVADVGQEHGTGEPGGGTPTEPRIELMDRLRREGRWLIAEKAKNATIKTLRKGGMKRLEARAAAWRRLALDFPPLPPPVEAKPEAKAGTVTEPDPDVAEWEELLVKKLGLREEAARFFVPILNAVCKEVEREIREWQQRFAISLSDEARNNLGGEVVMWFWNEGWFGRIPGMSGVKPGAGCKPGPYSPVPEPEKVAPDSLADPKPFAQPAGQR